ncbi:MAG: GTPase ObgE [Clostridiales Family XIII bacterium]|jgi:GTP-binding protein|nr:GTPase ObgE [Clostridiales Family XIII bacterium]
MFVDRAEIIIKSGKGGDGAVSFRHEPFVPDGGPDGGNGGRGGDIVFKADRNLNTLMDVRYRKKYKAPSGEGGMGRLKAGKQGENLIIKLPVGSVIIDQESGSFMADLSEDGVEFVAAVGGKGGLGNSNFKNSKRQAPNFAEAGTQGQERTVLIELKLIADVGLIGLPNVGKSTFLSVSTGARPKIANYHFTTITPNLGVVELANTSFVIADIPGLIEGAAEGSGLGHDFLKHVERTKMLVHVIDASGSEGRRPLDDFKIINAEMKQYSERLMKKPQIVALNKMDIADPTGEAFLELIDFLKKNRIEYYEISAATRQGVPDVLNYCAGELVRIDEDEQSAEIDEKSFSDQSLWMKVTRIEDDPDYRVVHISIDEEGNYVLSGKQLEKIFNSTNFNDVGSLTYLNNYLEDGGIIRKLKARGMEDGDTIKIKDFEMEYIDEDAED